MKILATFCVTVLIFGSVALSQDQPSTPDRAPLLLVQQIPLPNVGGRIDHFTFDGKRFWCMHRNDRNRADWGVWLSPITMG